MPSLGRDCIQHVRLSDVESLLEQRVANEEARTFARRVADFVGRGHEFERGHRRDWDEIPIESSEEIGRDLPAQLRGVLCHDAPFQRCPVDQLQWPGADPQDWASKAELLATRDEPSETDVREGARHIGEDFDGGPDGCESW